MLVTGVTGVRGYEGIEGYKGARVEAVQRDVDEAKHKVGIRGSAKDLFETVGGLIYPARATQTHLHPQACLALKTATAIRIGLRGVRTRLCSWTSARAASVRSYQKGPRDGLLQIFGLV